jgi:hypothetical protein
MHEAENLSDAALAYPQICIHFSEHSSQAMVALEGRKCIIRYANAAFVNLTGVARSQLIGHTFGVACPQGDRDGCVPLLERVYDTGVPEALPEQLHTSVPPSYWSYAAWPILGGGAVPVGAMLHVTDSTEIAIFRDRSVRMNESLLMAGIRQHELIEASEVLNERLQSAMKEKDYFIAVLSHELRTPLAPVLIGASALLEDHAQTPDSSSSPR